MPESDSPVGSKSETKYDAGGIQHALSSAKLGAEVQNMVQWFDALGAGERMAVLHTLAAKCTETELRFLRDTAQHSQIGVFDRLAAEQPHLESHRSPLRLAKDVQKAAPQPPHSPMRPYIGKQDHFAQAFLRPQTFNPWPLSQEIIRPKSATDWWSTPQPKPIGRPKELHHSDGEGERRRMVSAPSTPTPSAQVVGGSGGAQAHAQTQGQAQAHAQAQAQAQTKAQPPPSLQSPHKPVNYMDPALLADMGAWLRSLRLHKYTDNLGGMRWQEVIQLNDAELEARGVNALGARRKMLKMFEEIKAAQEAGKLGPGGRI